ncbi:Long-chain fatty acid transport protein 4 [Halotydeus destructor]|nr:Long-chain fatty acid transport protein 4 [Halotydeus destructor]
MKIISATIYRSLFTFNETNMYIYMCTVVLIFLIAGGWKFLWVFHCTWPRDLRSLLRLLRTKIFLYRLRSKNHSVAHVFRENVRKHPDRIAIYHKDVAWTFQELDAYSNQMANVFLGLGFEVGDEVALFMESRPEYVGTWLGLAKAGVVTALINTNLRGDTLAHSITCINSKAVIVDEKLSEHFCEVVDIVMSKGKPTIYTFGPAGETSMSGFEARPLKPMVKSASASLPDPELRAGYYDKLFYLYTSGTTGLPKAAIIKHCRYVWIGSALRLLSGMKTGATIYTCIPLYHLAGGVLGTNQCLIWGDTLVVRHKFSASQFWEDCVKYKCDTAQYIGEICRYLLAQPPKSTDREHPVRTLFGNGLRTEIWSEFVKRFGIKHVREFYGSTEGNANIINNDDQEGACGFISQIVPAAYPVALIRIDESSGEPVRGPDGLCLRAGPGESGEFVGKIVAGDASRAFDGYVDKSATEKKIVKDVFRKGDAAFLSGDLLKMDMYGYVYFKDRTGDTFRWKGENVSTTQVESLISKVLKLTDCIVYGVQVPFCEGQAGMAAILDTDKDIDLNQFTSSLSKIMPIFSIPVFIRLVNQIESTGTYKLPKTCLQKQGYDPQFIHDPLFMFDSKNRIYMPLDSSLYEKIINGQVSL